MLRDSDTNVWTKCAAAPNAAIALWLQSTRHVGRVAELGSQADHARTVKPITITLIAVGVVLVVAGAVIVVPGRLRESSREAATARFRDTAIAEVTRLAADLSAITNQVAAMAKQTDEEDRWLSAHLIVTRSGEWLVFVSKCSKEDPKIRDTFVCRASDGRWYESSFHFCKGVIVLRMEGQPPDLQSFIRDHKLSEFQFNPY